MGEGSAEGWEGEDGYGFCGRTLSSSSPMTITFLLLPFWCVWSSSSESGIIIASDLGRVETGGPGNGVAFPKFGEGEGIGKGCKVRDMGVGVPIDWALTGTPPLGTLRANWTLAASRVVAMGVDAVEETDIGLPAVEAMKIGWFSVPGLADPAGARTGICWVAKRRMG